MEPPPFHGPKELTAVSVSHDEGTHVGDLGSESVESVYERGRALRKLVMSSEPRLEEIRDLLATHPNLANVTDSSGKNALHMAAWKGSILHVACLLESNADVNKVSTGPHNYGKSPIFYAITRDRDDVVVKLLEMNASPNIVNNKGQSVLSLAASHCKRETIAAIIRSEQQHKSFGWANYRATHSDELEYGDLDPRFVDGPSRMIVPDATEPYSINASTRQSRKGNFYRNNPGVEGRRNLRDVIDWSQCYCLNEHPDHTLANIFMGNPALYLRSNDDNHQLLITLSFKEPVRLTHLNFVAVATSRGPCQPMKQDSDSALVAGAGTGPLALSLFSNVGRIGFEDIVTTTPCEALCLEPADLNPGKSTALSTTAFSNVLSLSILVKSNQCGAKVSALRELLLFGNPLRTTTEPKRKRKSLKKEIKPSFSQADIEQLWAAFHSSFQLSLALNGDHNVQANRKLEFTALEALTEAVVKEASNRKSAPDFHSISNRIGILILDACQNENARSALSVLQAAMAQVPSYVIKDAKEAHSGKKRKSMRRTCKVMVDAIASVATRLFEKEIPSAERVLEKCWHNIDLFCRILNIFEFPGDVCLENLQRIVDEAADAHILKELVQHFPQAASLMTTYFTELVHEDLGQVRTWAEDSNAVFPILKALNEAAKEQIRCRNLRILARLGDCCWSIASKHGIDVRDTPDLDHLTLAMEANTFDELNKTNQAHALSYAQENMHLREMITSFHIDIDGGTRLRGDQFGSLSDDIEFVLLDSDSEIVLVDNCDNLRALLADLKYQETDSNCRIDDIAVDCEWRHPRPISLVQLAVSSKRIYLLDFVASNDECVNEMCSVLKWLFESETIRKRGFSFRNDWVRLRMLLGCDAQLNNLLDLQLNPPVAVKLNNNNNLMSLGQVVHQCFGLRLDKSQQRSNWDARPLSQDQICYAALDAAVLMRLD